MLIWAKNAKNGPKMLKIIICNATFCCRVAIAGTISQKQQDWLGHAFASVDI